jgi:predicted peptidase
LEIKNSLFLNIMKIQRLLLFIIFAQLMSCGEKITTSVNCEQSGPPIFTTLPAVKSGSSSIDFVFSLNQKSTIYYVVYSSDQAAITSAQIKEEALSTAANTQVLAKQAVDISCTDIAAEIVVTAADLQENQVVFAYLVAESNSLDIILQDSPSFFQVQMLERQPVLTFNSAADSREVLYLVYQPEEALKNSDETFPAIIFLGGWGETSSQGQINLIRNGTLPEYISKGNDIPFLVFSPQHIVNNWNADMVNEMVEEAKAKYPIDPNQIHMTGISGGGIGTWNYAVKYPEQLASVVPISGDGNDGQACNMVNVATWAFHNEGDGLVSTSGSINMVAAINACNPGPATVAKVTLFEDPGHNAWRRVYDINHSDWANTTVAPVDIYAWILTQSK